MLESLNADVSQLRSELEKLHNEGSMIIAIVPLWFRRNGGDRDLFHVSTYHVIYAEHHLPTFVEPEDVPKPNVWYGPDGKPRP